MPIGALNPADLSHSTATRPASVLNAVNQRRWMSDDLATVIMAQDFNSVMGMVRYAYDFYGIPDVEGDDTLLQKAIAAGAGSLSGNIAMFQALVGGADKVPFFTGASAMSLFTATSFSRSLLAYNDATQWRNALGISAALSANVVAFGNLASAPNTIGYFTGPGTMAVTGFTAFARTFNATATASDARDALGLGTAAVQPTSFFAAATDLALKADLASPVFTGNPTAPTQSASNNSTRIATTAFVATSFAPLASPAFTGSPTAPTTGTANNSTQIATTAYVQANLASYATSASPSFTGTATFTDIMVTKVAGGGITVTLNSDGSQRQILGQTNGNNRWSLKLGDVTADSGNLGSECVLTAYNNAGSLGNVWTIARSDRIVNFTVTPTAPTPPTADDSISLATTAFVKRQNASPTFSGNVTVAGAGGTSFTVSGDSGSFRQIIGQTAGVNRWALRLGDNVAELGGPGGVGSQCVLTAYDNTGAALGTVWVIPRFSRIVDFTLSPTAPTPATADNSFSLATTAYVKANLATYAVLASPALTGIPTAPTPATADNSVAIATTSYVKANLASYATLASPALTGAPTSTTAGATDSSTRIATTAYVQNNLALYALLASPALSGNPTATTQAITNNSTRIATTAFVQAVLSAYSSPYTAVTTVASVAPSMLVGWYGCLIQLSSGAPQSVALPDEATLAVPIGTWIDFVQWGTGQTTFSAGGVAVVNSSAGMLRTIRYGIVRAVKMAVSTWLLSGAGLTT